MLLAEDIALPVVSRVGVVDHASSQWYQKGVVMKLGCPLDVTKILPAERPSIAQQMIRLVSRLHEKGVIHGDIKPANFVKKIDGEGLRMVGFSSARMADNSDLSLWLDEAPTLEYTAPSRAGGQDSGPPSIFDDDFALAVSIWAVFAGENPGVGLFHSNEGHTPDVTKITDDDLFRTVVDVLERGGLRLDPIHTASRGGAPDLHRTASNPLSLPDADRADEDPGQQDEAKARPRFRPHGFETAMAADAGTRSETTPPPPQQHPVEHPAACPPRTSGEHDLGSVSDYALEWLLAQGGAAAGCDHEEPWTPVLGDGRILPRRPSAPGLGLRPSLRVDTGARPFEVDEPVRSGVSGATTSGATIVPADRTILVGREPATAALSESDEGYQSMPPGRSCAASLTDSEQADRPWPSSEHGNSETAADPNSYASSPPLTPMPPMLTLLHRQDVSSRFDNVALSDFEEGRGAEK